MLESCYCGRARSKTASRSSRATLYWLPEEAKRSAFEEAVSRQPKVA